MIYATKSLKYIKQLAYIQLHILICTWRLFGNIIWLLPITSSIMSGFINHGLYSTVLSNTFDY